MLHCGLERFPTTSSLSLQPYRNTMSSFLIQKCSRCLRKGVLDKGLHVLVWLKIFSRVLTFFDKVFNNRVIFGCYVTRKTRSGKPFFFFFFFSLNTSFLATYWPLSLKWKFLIKNLNITQIGRKDGRNKQDNLNIPIPYLESAGLIKDKYLCLHLKLKYA